LAWLVEREWATTAEDVLWRRSKLGLVMTPAEAREIAAYLASVTRGSGSPAAAASAPAGRTAYR
jgi:glycerol-3-phosphate dehydrogenase